ncbi:MAG TPA: chorismate-binding protein [Vicinamibacterales bacterium]|nr:chorismate-binding protein [Vicinamibacterales bacterium]
MIPFVSDRFSAYVQVGPSRWLSFRDPSLVLQADSPAAVRRTLADVEQLTRDRGLHAVGFVAFEAASAFGLATRALPEPVLPLAWFALYEASHVVESGPPARTGDYLLGPLTPSIDRPAFDAAFGRIKEQLAAGNAYQVNFTFTMEGRFDGDAFSIFADLCAAQRGHHGAFIDLGDAAICSASPELFFEFQGTTIVARPMKGTASRGRTLDEDTAAGAALAASQKERAENVMIVDMIRNDLGRVAEVGSVSVPELFVVERYPNVWQMTSEVRARSVAPLEEVFAALHPSASVTGAPKARTMELLAELEVAPRGVYTGAIGHVPPDGLAHFSVAIRTAVIDRPRSRLSFGIGSGIVWDSKPDAEYAECLLKGAILARRPAPFDLLETLRWTPDEGYYLLDRHLARLRRSAEYFGVPILLSEIQNALSMATGAAQDATRVRLLVAPDGRPRTEVRPHEPTPGVLRVTFSAEPIDSSDVFLFHKTTRREVYDRARAGWGAVDEVILWNERGEVTEATTANLVADVGGDLITPPVGCGLLAGTMRAELLEGGEIREGILMRHHLAAARRLWLINSVHGMRAVELITP